MFRHTILSTLIAVLWLSDARSLAAEKAELILHNGKIVTVDAAFSIHQGMAVSGARIVKLGKNDDILALRGDDTTVIDLSGKTVVPGLIDSHTHPGGAAMHEFDHEIPTMETIAEVLEYIKSRAAAVGEGKWITVRQVFVTRLKEQRYPTREELDRAAPNNPVVFSTGPDASVNSLALKLSGIDKDSKVTGKGYLERDPSTGEPTGILRSCTYLIKSESTGKSASQEDRLRRLKSLFRDYNSVGITAISDRNANSGDIERYRLLHAGDQLTVRMALSHGVGTDGDVENIQAAIRKVAEHPLVKGDDMLRIVGIKTFLDGGMLTGSAYMREPWGVSQIYSIQDPQYRGLLYIPREKLLPIVESTLEAGLQFTAHSVGDGAVHTLLDVYEELNRKQPIRDRRPCLTHSNFMSREAVEKAAALGVVVDIQPAWLWLDGKTLLAQFGSDRLRYFQPLASIFAAGGIAGGGSDHMQKIGSFRSVNPYNPFLGMWISVVRVPRGMDQPLHREESLTREQALRFYTANNAYVLFLDKVAGTLEPGKLADFAILETDVLTCPAVALRETKVEATYLGGKQVYP
ncbi:MAG: amidohydrolase [Pirellulales bacterium]